MPIYLSIEALVLGAGTRFISEVVLSNYEIIHELSRHVL